MISRLFFLLVFVFAWPCYAQAPLTAKNIQVDVQADNAAKARDEAIITAQRQALSAIATQFGLTAETPKASAEASDDKDSDVSESTQQSHDMGESPQIAAVARLTDPQIARLVRDFEITDEQHSATRYRANFAVRFHRQATLQALGLPAYTTFQDNHQNAFNSQTASPVSTAAKTLLILPVLQAGQRYVLWQDPNPWRQAWQNLSLPQAGDFSLKIPLGDILDIRDLQTDTLSQNMAPERLNALKTRYDVDEIVLALARSDSAPYAPQNTMDISFYRIGANQQSPAYRGEVTAILSQSDNLDPFVQGVNETLLALKSGRLMAHSLGESAESLQQMTSQTFFAEAAYQNLQQWAQIQRQLRNIPAITAFLPERFSAKGAKLKIEYDTDISNLINDLRAAGFLIQDSQNGGLPIMSLGGS